MWGLRRHLARRIRRRFVTAPAPVPDRSRRRVALPGPYQWLLPAGTPAAALAGLGLPAATVTEILDSLDLQTDAATVSVSYSSTVAGSWRRIFTPYGAVTMVQDPDRRLLSVIDVDGSRTEQVFDVRGNLTILRIYVVNGVIENCY
jgi:hypothetical protein